MLKSDTEILGAILTAIVSVFAIIKYVWPWVRSLLGRDKVYWATIDGATVPIKDKKDPNIYYKKIRLSNTSKHVTQVEIKFSEEIFHYKFSEKIKQAFNDSSSIINFEMQPNTNLELSIFSSSIWIEPEYVSATPLIAKRTYYSYKGNHDFVLDTIKFTTVAFIIFTITNFGMDKLLSNLFPGVHP